MVQKVKDAERRGRRELVSASRMGFSPVASMVIAGRCDRKPVD